MKEIPFTVIRSDGATSLQFSVARMVNAGYVGRNQEEVRYHIEELKKHGVPGPATVPTLYSIVTAELLQTEQIEVIGEETSGEAEFVLLVKSAGEIYVAAGSDHTDRGLETVSIELSKNICPNIISREVWAFGDVLPHWDNIMLRSWVTREGNRTLYQEAPLGSIMTPQDLLDFVRSRVSGTLENTVVYSGTIGTVGGRLIFGDRFEVEVADPVRGGALRCDYKVSPLRYMKKG
jgi:hypothetical protein